MGETVDLLTKLASLAGAKKSLLTEKNVNLHRFSRVLDLSSMGISSIDWDELHTALPRLRTLDLSDNNLQELPKKLGCTELRIKEINLSSNKIVSVPRTTFDNCPELRSVDISNNLILQLPDGIFAKNADLRALVASGNPLQAIPKSLRQCRQLVRLELADTQLPHEMARTHRGQLRRTFDKLSRTPMAITQRAKTTAGVLRAKHRILNDRQDPDQRDEIGKCW